MTIIPITLDDLKDATIIDGGIEAVKQGQATIYHETLPIIERLQINWDDPQDVIRKFMELKGHGEAEITDAINNSLEELTVRAEHIKTMAWFPDFRGIPTLMDYMRIKLPHRIQFITDWPAKNPKPNYIDQNIINVEGKIYRVFFLEHGTDSAKITVNGEDKILPVILINGRRIAIDIYTEINAIS